MIFKAFYIALVLSAVNCFADEKECNIHLTGSPYCVSRANAGRICRTVGATDDGLLKIKKCLVDFSTQLGGMSRQVQALCLAGFVQTGDLQQDSSNCTERRSEAEGTETST